MKIVAGMQFRLQLIFDKIRIQSKKLVIYPSLKQLSNTSLILLECLL